MKALSAQAQQAVAVLFAPSLQGEAQQLLEAFCIEFPGAGWEQLSERVRLAALKVSNGDIARLCEAIDLAALDWRDLLVAAGFAEDTLAHLEWRPAPR